MRLRLASGQPVHHGVPAAERRSAKRQLGPSVIASREKNQQQALNPVHHSSRPVLTPPGCRHLVPPGASCMSSPAVQPPVRTPEKPQRGQKIGLEVTSWHS